MISLINALENRPFNGINLQNAAIQRAFFEGASRGIMCIVKEFHEHPTIVSDIYVNGLIKSWMYDNSRKIAFPYLLSHADQSDLEQARQMWGHEQDPQFCKAIDEATRTAPLAGTRHRRFSERTTGLKR